MFGGGVVGGAVTGAAGVTLYAVALALLIYAALHDLAARTVPNWLPLALLAPGLALRAMDHTLPAGLGVALGTFVLLVGVWLGGAMGGGDVKLWAATVPLVPPVLPRELGFFLAVVIGGGVLAVVYLLLGAVVRRPGSRLPNAGQRVSARVAARPGKKLARLLRAEAWRIGRRAPLPYACAIAAGAVATLLPFCEVR